MTPEDKAKKFVETRDSHPAYIAAQLELAESKMKHAAYEALLEIAVDAANKAVYNI